MTQFKRFAAFLLCFLMIFPTQELMILAETTSMEYERIGEMPSSDITEDGADRMEETQPSETVEDGTDRVEETQP